MRASNLGMDTTQQKRKAQDLIALHRGDDVLVLPNVWDVASARIVEDAGYRALATTSAGIAFSLGYPDGQKIPRRHCADRACRKHSGNGGCRVRIWKRP